MEGYGRGRKVTGGYGRLRKVTGDRSLGYGGYGRSREVTEVYGRLHEVTAPTPVPLPCHFCTMSATFPLNCRATPVPPLSLLYHSVPYRHIIVICFDGSMPLISFAFKGFFRN